MCLGPDYPCRCEHGAVPSHSTAAGDKGGCPSRRVLSARVHRRTLQSVPGRPSVLWLSEKPQSTPSQGSSYVPILVKAVLSSCLQGADRNSLPRQAASNTSLGVWCLTPSPKQADSLRRHLLHYQFPPSDHCVL